MDKKIIAGTTALGIIAAAGIGAGAWAYQGNSAQSGPNYTFERHLKMEKAFDEVNYDDWKALINMRSRVAEVINADNFPRFAEMHKLREEGRIEEANQIRRELGLGLGEGQNRGYGKLNSERHGQNQGGNFVDINNDNICDYRQ